MTRAGRLRHMCRIEEFTETPNAGGQPIKTWTVKFRDVPCDVRHVAGGESLRGRQVSATANYMVELRWIGNRDGQLAIEPDMRIVDHLNRTLEIVALDDPRGRELELFIDCKAGV